jgi:hypothetical protein
MPARDARLGAARRVHERVARVLEALSIELRVALACRSRLAVGLDERREGADQALGHRGFATGPHLGDLDADLARGSWLDVRDLVAGDLGGAQRRAPCRRPRARGRRWCCGRRPTRVRRGRVRARTRGSSSPGVLAAAVGAGEEAVRVAEGEADLEDEVEVAVAVERRALVDEEEAEHAGAGLEAVDLGGAQLAAEAQATRASGQRCPSRPPRASGSRGTSTCTGPCGRAASRSGLLVSLSSATSTLMYSA